MNLPSTWRVYKPERAGRPADDRGQDEAQDRAGQNQRQINDHRFRITPPCELQSSCSVIWAAARACSTTRSPWPSTTARSISSGLEGAPLHAALTAEPRLHSHRLSDRRVQFARRGRAPAASSAVGRACVDAGGEAARGADASAKARRDPRAKSTGDPDAARSPGWSRAHAAPSSSSTGTTSRTPSLRCAWASSIAPCARWRAASAAGRAAPMRIWRCREALADMAATHLGHHGHGRLRSPASVFSKPDLAVSAELWQRLARDLSLGPRRIPIVVCPTSWTPDEDFDLLLETLERTERKLVEVKGKAEPATPDLAVLMTGRGPLKPEFEKRLARRTLGRVAVRTVWLEPADYPVLVGMADAGLCLHQSSSGLDLPMKLADFRGAGVPVCAYDYAPVISEVLTNGSGRRHVPRPGRAGARARRAGHGGPRRRPQVCVRAHLARGQSRRALGRSLASRAAAVFGVQGSAGRGRATRRPERPRNGKPESRTRNSGLVGHPERHPSCSAVDGSIVDARQAGTMAASPATSSISTTTDPRAIGSRAPTSKS